MGTTERPGPEELLAQTTWLRALAAGLLGDAAAAEDAVQETWVAALRNPPEPRASLRPWLATVLRNLVRSRWRADRQRQKRELRASEAPPSVPSPEELLSEHEEVRALAALVSGLREPFRSTVLLCYQRGLTPTEVAHQQGVPAGTVRWRLKQALDELRGRLDERHGGDRRKWRALLIPVAWRPREATAAVATGLAVKLVAVLGVLVVAGAVWRWWPARPHGSVSPPLTAAEMRQRVRLTTAQTQPPAPIDFGSIDGRVTNPDGSPAAGASVFVMRPMSLYEQRASAGAIIGPVATATADGAGIFHLTAPAGRCAVYALGEKGRPAGREPVEVRAGASTRVDLALLAGGYTLEGSILDAGGGSIAGARVVVDEFNIDFSRAARFYEVRTDDRGHYAFHLGAGHYSVRASADGYAREAQEVFVVRAQRLNLRLYPGARFSGRVVDRETRQPVAGADVSLVAFDQLGVSAARVSSGDDGGFSIADVRGGAYRVMATVEGRVGVSAIVRAASAESTDGIEVIVAPGIELKGRVTDGAGHAVGGATVALRAQKPPLERFPLARTSPDGTFVLGGLFPSTLTLHAEAEGHGTVDLPLTIAPHLAPVEVKLAAPTIVAGTVLDAGGQPVEGALVTAGNFAATTSGAGGAFRLASVVPGEVTVMARDPERGVASAEPRRLRAGDSVSLTLRLEPGATVEGTVRDEAGAPVAGVKVVGGSIGSYQTLTDEGGRYRVTGLPAGRFSIWALRKDHSLVSSTEKRPDTRTLTLQPGEVRTLDLVIGRGGQRIGGLVVDPAGQPVTGANVSARASRNGPSFNDAIGDTTVVSDQSGRFLFDDLVAGAFTLRAWHPRFGDVEQASVSTGATDLRVAFAPAGGVAGTLRRADGRPVTDAAVRVLAPRPGSSPAERSMGPLEKLPSIPVHDPGGAFVIEPLAPGRYQLEATTLDGERGAVEVSVEPGPRRELRIVLAPTVRLVGRVVDGETGEGLGGIAVGVGDLLGYHDVQSRPDGSFTLGGLADAAPIYASLSDRANLHLGEVLKLEPAAGTLLVDAGTIRLRAGDPRKESLGISWTMENGRPRLLAVEEGSRGERAGLRPKDVLLSVNGADATALTTGAFRYQLGSAPATTLTVQAPGQEPRTITLRRPRRD